MVIRGAKLSPCPRLPRLGPALRTANGPRLPLQSGSKCLLYSDPITANVNRKTASRGKCQSWHEAQRSHDCLFWTHNLPRCHVPSHISIQDTCVQTGPLKNYKSNVVLGTHDSPYCLRDFNLLRLACSGYNYIPSISVWHHPVQQVRGYKIWVLWHLQPFLTITAITARSWLAASYEEAWTMRPQDPAKRW